MKKRLISGFARRLPESDFDIGWFGQVISLSILVSNH